MTIHTVNCCFVQDSDVFATVLEMCMKFELLPYSCINNGEEVICSAMKPLILGSSLKHLLRVSSQ